MGYNKGENIIMDKVIRKEINEGNVIPTKNISAMQGKSVPTKNAFVVLDKANNVEDQRQGEISSSIPEEEHDVAGPEHGRGGGNPLLNG